MWINFTVQVVKTRDDQANFGPPPYPLDAIKEKSESHRQSMSQPKVQPQDTEPKYSVNLPMGCTIKELEVYMKETTQDFQELHFTLQGKSLVATQTLAQAGVVEDCTIIAHQGPLPSTKFVITATTTKSRSKTILNTSNHGKLTLSTANELSHIDHSKVRPEFITMLSLKAPKLLDKKRLPVDLIMVIDRSGSMTSLMQLVLELAKFVIQQLQDDDQLGIIVYDDVVDTVLPLIPMTEKGKALASAAVKVITPRGSTNLSSGLYTGMNMALTRDPQIANETCSVLLFTDGDANRGDQNLSIIQGKMLDTNFLTTFNAQPDNNTNSFSSSSWNPSTIVSRMVGHSKTRTTTNPNPSTNTNMGKFSVNTFGFGRSHNVELLQGIAKTGNGMYNLIEDASQIGPAFIECIGGLLSMVTQDISICVDPWQDVTIMKVFGDYPVKNYPDHGAKIITIRDMQSEEQRDILLQLNIQSSHGCAVEDTLLLFTVTYKNLTSQERDQEEIITTINRDDAQEKQPHIGVDVQKNRLIAVDALKEASRLGRERQLSEARQVLIKAIARIHASPSKSDLTCVALVTNIKQAYDKYPDQQTFDAVGDKYSSSSCDSHASQRSNVQTRSLYTNEIKSNIQSNYLKTG
jgi:uncharacterized protein with von Willebrand factor type A (vWA) domain